MRHRRDPSAGTTRVYRYQNAQICFGRQGGVGEDRIVRGIFRAAAVSGGAGLAVRRRGSGGQGLGARGSGFGLGARGAGRRARGSGCGPWSRTPGRGGRRVGELTVGGLAAGRRGERGIAGSWHRGLVGGPLARADTILGVPEGCRMRSFDGNPLELRSVLIERRPRDATRSGWGLEPRTAMGSDLAASSVRCRVGSARRTGRSVPMKASRILAQRTATGSDADHSALAIIRASSASDPASILVMTAAR